MRLFAEPLPAKLVWDEGELVALVVALYHFHRRDL